MSRFRIRLLLTHKIAAIAVIGVAGIALIGAIYLIGAMTQEHYRQAAAAARRIYDQAHALQANLLQSRRVEADFLLRSNMGYVNRFRGIEKEVRADIEKLREAAEAAKLDEVTVQADIIRNAFDKYTSQFLLLSQAREKLGLDPRSGLEGSLRESAAIIEEKVREIDDTRLLSMVLTMRRHEKNFMLRHDPAYGEEMARTIAEMKASLADARMLLEVKTDVEAKLAAYETDFKAWMDAASQMANDQLVMSEAYSEIDPAIRWLITTADEMYQRANEANLASRTGVETQMQIALLAIALAVCGLAFWIGRTISRPITAVTRAMGALAEGRNDIEIAGTDRGDEIGAMARAVVVFRDAAIAKTRLEAETEQQRKLTEAERGRSAEAQARAAEEQAGVVRALAEGLKRLSEGDLTYRLSDGFTDAYLQIKDDFNATMDRLQETMAAIAASMQEVTSASAEISASTTDLSQRTEEQAASLEETSASMEEMAATVKKNAENAREANQFAVGTREIADRGGEVVSSAVTSMARIEQSSKKISDIIGVIDEIAFQTNLLALNAAVEAARAGEAGRGFAVVAAEVRSLAQRSSQAAKDIKELINNSSDQVQEGVELVNRAGTALTEIVESIKKVADIVAEIASASAEQSTGIDQINTALSQMDEVTQQNSALVEENAASAKALEEVAITLQERVNQFRLADEAENFSVVPEDRPAAAAVANALRRRPVEEREAAPPEEAAAAAPMPVPARAKANGRGPVARMQTALATAFQQDPEWKEF